MGTVFTIAAIIGLLIFIIGAIIWLVGRPRSAVVMVIGALVYAIAHILLLVDVLI